MNQDPEARDPTQTHNYERQVRKQILSLFSDDRLKGKFSIPEFTFHQIRIQLLIQKETLKVQFQKDFPETAPIISLQNSTLPANFEKFLITDEWTPRSKLADFIANIYENIQNLVESENMYSVKMGKKEEQMKIKEQKQSSDQITKKKVMMNGCADTELTETKNLNRHFRSKLRQVYNDIIKYGDVSVQQKNLEEAFTNSRVGFDDISALLKLEWFNKEVKKQMKNGKFMHKIMKGMMSIKSKKLMVKYYHVMLAAVEEPQNFVKWKYQ